MVVKKIIIYDFDGTLTPNSIPKFEMLEKCRIKGIKKNKFYLQVIRNSITKNISLYQALYETYFELIKKSGFKVDDDNLCLGSNNIVYNKGVYDFLSDLQKNDIDNYLLSSGLRVFLDRISIASLFSEIYATTFNYDENNEVVSIKYLMNGMNKVEMIKKIILENNGTCDDCSNIIYIGDGLTDMYAMEYVKNHGGVSILVYNDKGNIDIKAIMRKNIVSFLAPADFSLNSKLNCYVKKLCNIK